MNVRDITTLDRAAHWLDELLKASRIRGTLYGHDPKLAADVTRKAKALQTVLRKFREAAEKHEKPA